MDFKNKDLNKGSKLEDEIDLEYYKTCPMKTPFYYLILVLTLGLFKYYLNDYRYIFYKKTSLDKAGFVKINNKKRKEITLKNIYKKKVSILSLKEPKMLTYFNYKYHLYYYSSKKGGFKIIKNKLIDYINLHSKNMNLEQGLNDDENMKLIQTYGKNVIKVKSINVFLLFIQQLLSPFTIYQFGCSALWIFNEYEIYSYILIGLTFLSIIVYIYQVKKQNNKTIKMAYHEARVQVKRNNEFVDKSSLYLAIGDVIKIPSDKTIPCDILLLKGKCIVKEAMLTGETEPIIKSSYNPNHEVQKNNIIYAGTNCMLSRHEKDNAIGVVVNTGFYTFKGELVRSLLLGESEEFQFNRDVLYFLLGILCISISGFIFYLYHELNYGTDVLTQERIIIRSFEFFATAIPPTLPLVLTMALEVAMMRLKQYGIHTVIIGKINESGRVKIMCFDKTGTLTESGLIYRGILGKTNKEDNEFSEFKFQLEEFSDSEIDRELLKIMGCCHGLSYLDNLIIGDPLELEMFNNSGWEMIEDELGKTHFKPKSELKKIYNESITQSFVLVKKIDFTPERKRFSAILKEESSNTYFLFTKGAPDIIKDICDAKTVPINFTEELNAYSQKGLRILAIASKPLFERDLNNTDEELEKDLNFEGFIFFENPLKPVTKSVIDELKQNGIINIMITGDNLLTAYNVGMNCDIISHKESVWSGKMEKNNLCFEKFQNISSSSLAKNKSFTLDHDEFKTNLIEIPQINNLVDVFNNSENDFENKIETLIQICINDNSKIILTGDAFEYFHKNYMKENSKYNELIKHTLIFGRTNPHQKALIVKTFKEILKNEKITKKSQYFVGFCGDGANDCPALKTANVGLSLSDLEASIAAPFTSTVTDISNVPNLLKEGKASLHSIIQNFKYILCYALFQFYGMLFCFVLGLDFAAAQYYALDLITYFPMTVIICLTRSSPKLVKAYPLANLVNFEILLAFLGDNVIVLIGYGLLVLYMVRNNSYLDVEEMEVDLMERTQDDYYFRVNYYIFLYNQIIILFFAVIVSKGPPFRMSWFRNYYFLGHFIIIIIIVSLLIFVRTDPDFKAALFFNTILRKLDYETEELTYIVLYCGFFVLILTFYERNVVPEITACYRKIKQRIRMKRNK